MVKKVGLVMAATAAGAFLAGGVATAATPDAHEHGQFDQFGQFGLLNLNSTDVLHNVNGTLGVCDLDVNVLIVQVPIHDTLNGVNGHGGSPDNCASGAVADGGTSQGH
jgi:hypothetical protein